MIAIPPTHAICYPPAPLNGGPLESAPPKVGEWVWQPKVDDRRVVIHTPTRTIWNQYGQLSVAQDSDRFEVALDRLATVSFAAEWLDCGLMEYRNDMMRGSVIVLDLIEAGVEQWRRYARLKAMFDMLPWARAFVGTEAALDGVFLIPQVDGEEAGRALYKDCLIENGLLGRKFYEGVVAKKRDSLYPFCTRPKTKIADWVKSRFDQA